VTTPFSLALAVLVACDGSVDTPSATDSGTVRPRMDAGMVPPGTDAGALDPDAGGRRRDAAIPSHPTSDGPWANATGNLADMPSECGNTPLVSTQPDEDMVIAGVALHGLWASDNGGESWSALGGGAGSDTITNRPSSIVYDPSDPDVFWESGIYNGGGVYRTDDNGQTFVRLGDIGHNDLVAIDLGDASRRTLLAGGHEQSQTLYRSTDGGETWTNVGMRLPSGTAFSSYPLVLDARTFLVGCSGWGDGMSGIFRSEDGGDTWSRVSEEPANNAPLLASDGSIYWPKVWGGGMLRSTDRGATWEEVTGGGTITSVAPIELPDGRIATLSGSAVVLSSDGGRSWTEVTSMLPYGDSVGVVYSRQRRAFFIWHFSCGDRVLPDAIMRHDFDWEAP
jgi:photosystem II stability/assembly factor-like uncharacterized protein